MSALMASRPRASRSALSWARASLVSLTASSFAARRAISCHASRWAIRSRPDQPWAASCGCASCSSDRPASASYGAQASRSSSRNSIASRYMRPMVDAPADRSRRRADGRVPTDGRPAGRRPANRVLRGRADRRAGVRAGPGSAIGARGRRRGARPPVRDRPTDRGPVRARHRDPAAGGDVPRLVRPDRGAPDRLARGAGWCARRPRRPARTGSTTPSGEPSSAWRRPRRPTSRSSSPRTGASPRPRGS